MSQIDQKQVSKAVKALMKYLSKQKESKPETTKSLLPESDGDYILLTITTKTMPDKTSVKPIPILLKHSIIPDNAEICLITKDPQREFKDLVASKGLEKSITKVIGVSKLKAKFKPFEAKRQLCSSFDLFLADERVLPLLPGVLGKAFFNKKKQPIPINLQKSDKLDIQLKQILNSTFLHLSKGVSLTVKIGHSSRLGVKENIENIMESIEDIIKKIPKKWDNIQSLYLKTSESVALPIYNSLPLHTPLVEEQE